MNKDKIYREKICRDKMFGPKTYWWQNVSATTLTGDKLAQNGEHMYIDWCINFHIVLKNIPKKFFRNF